VRTSSVSVPIGQAELREAPGSRLAPARGWRATVVSALLPDVDPHAGRRDEIVSTSAAWLSAKWQG
jgi:hypothetical protein